MGHILMENRNGLIVDVEIAHASGTAEREAALAMLKRRGNRNKRATVGADKGYDSKAFIKGCRRLLVTPRGGQDKHSAVDGRIKRHGATKPASKCASESRRPLADQDSGRSGQDQIDRSGQTRGPGAAVLCHLQPGAHGQSGRLVGRASCVNHGIRAPEQAKRPANRPKWPLQSLQQASLRGSVSSKSTTLARSMSIFQRPARCPQAGVRLLSKGNGKWEQEQYFKFRTWIET